MASRRLARFALPFALGFALLGVARSSGGAEPGVRDRARALARQAEARYQAGDYERARALFREAYGLVPAPTIAVREARALAKLGRLLEAADAYRRASAVPLRKGSPRAFRRAVADARRELTRLQPRIPRLVVVAEASDLPGLRITVAGRPLPASLLGVERHVDPGTYTVGATAPGRTPRSELVRLRPGERQTVVLRLAPVPIAPAGDPAPGPEAALADAPAEPGSGLAVKAGWASLALGGVGLGVGIATGLAAGAKAEALEASCPGRRCAPELEGEVSAMRALRATSIAGYAVGVVGLGAGATLLLLRPGEGKDAPALAIGPSGAAVRGSF